MSDKKSLRREANRRSAARCRKRKRERLDELETENALLQQEIAHLKGMLAFATTGQMLFGNL
jgi:hypothetical protein